MWIIAIIGFLLMILSAIILVPLYMTETIENSLMPKLYSLTFFILGVTMCILSTMKLFGG